MKIRKRIAHLFVGHEVYPLDTLIEMWETPPERGITDVYCSCGKKVTQVFRDGLSGKCRVHWTISKGW